MAGRVCGRGATRHECSLPHHSSSLWSVLVGRCDGTSTQSMHNRSNTCASLPSPIPCFVPAPAATLQPQTPLPWPLLPGSSSPRHEVVEDCQVFDQCQQHLTISLLKYRLQHRKDATASTNTRPQNTATAWSLGGAHTRQGQSLTQCVKLQGSFLVFPHTSNPQPFPQLSTTRVDKMSYRTIPHQLPCSTVSRLPQNALTSLRSPLASCPP